MILSRNFISDYIDIKDKDINTIAEDMTQAGNEYDSCGKLINATKLVVGEVIECENIPDSDHLHVCKVNVGDTILDIVCGAPNVRKKIKVIVALDGAILPMGTIKKGRIRGYESNGMLCSLNELGLDHKFLTDKDIEGIHEFASDAVIGSDAIKTLGLDDEIIDFDLTSNRGDLLSMLGLSYELGAIYDRKVTLPDFSYPLGTEDINDFFKLNIETDNCKLFLSKMVKNVTIKESPDFIKNRLISSGIRPINNVVDISNYVMLETGQPLHFYDADKLGHVLGVRMAKDGEEIVTLDKVKRVLDSNDIVITTDNKLASLAGIMGGYDTEVTIDTKNILIEAAIFDSVHIRKTSKKGLRSEASNRFEKGLSKKRTYNALDRSCHLLSKYAGATILKGTLEYNKLEDKDKEIDITLDKINKVLGIDLSLDTVLNIFTRLGFTYTIDGNLIKVIIPDRKTDVNIKEDLIMEVGRIYGIDNIQERKMVLPVRKGSCPLVNRSIRHLLMSLGFNETLTYSLIKESEVKKYTTDNFNHIRLMDPMSEERSSLRYSLIPSLLNIYEYNTNRGNKDINLFEIGKGYYNKDNMYLEDNKLCILSTGSLYNKLGSDMSVNFYTIKGVMERVLDFLGYNNRYYLSKEDIPEELHPGQAASIYINKEKIGIIGKISPTVTKDDIYVLEINLDLLTKNKVSSMKYKEISKFPGITKDLAFIIDDNISSEEIMKAIKKSGGKLVSDINVFDLYKDKSLGDNKKSLAFSIYFEDANKTLTQEEVTTIFNKIIEDIVKKYNAVLRSC